MSVIEKLKDKLNSRQYPDDKIKFILANMEKEDIPKNYSVLHKFLYHLMQTNSNYKKLLNEFTFNKSCIFPYSKLLSKILYRLEASNYLINDNFNSDRYKIEQGLDTDGYKEKFSSKEIIILKEISQELDKLFL